MQDRPYNCPNCGAPIGYSDTCQYCGTLLRWMPMLQETYVVVEQRDIVPLRFRVKLPEGVDEMEGFKILGRNMWRELPAMLYPDFVDLNTDHYPISDDRTLSATIYVAKKKGTG